MVDHPDFARLDALLDEALDRPPAERAQWIASACGTDETLRARLLRLVALAEGDDEALPPNGGLRGEVWDELVRDLDEDTETEIRSGERMGRYEVRGLLGVGAMGRVYRAYDPALGREVAIKSLRQAWDQDATEDRRRFEREAAQLVVHERDQPVEGRRVAGLVGLQQACDLRGVFQEGSPEPGRHSRATVEVCPSRTTTGRGVVASGESTISTV